MMSFFETVTQALESLPRSVDPQKLAGMNTTTYFQLSGADVRDWTVRVDDGNLSVVQGAPQSADLTFKVAAEDLLAMFNGALNPVAAFMQGRIKVEGDLMQAMRLQALFS
jgi:putative sterol carrier protein